jgi:hypothetical protein
MDQVSLHRGARFPVGPRHWCSLYLTHDGTDLLVEALWEPGQPVALTAGMWDDYVKGRDRLLKLIMDGLATSLQHPLLAREPSFTRSAVAG